MAEPTVPRKIKTQQTKEKIFKAAQKLLEESGFEYLTVKNICREAGVSNGTFFYHFSTREDLMAYYLLTNYKEYLLDHWHQTEAAIDKEDFIQHIIALLSVYASYCQKTGVSFISAYYTSKNKALDTRSGNVNNRKPLGVTMNVAVDILTKAQEEGFVKTNISPLEAYLDCVTVTKGVIFEWCIADGHIDLIDHLTHMLSHYLSSIATDKYVKRFVVPTER